MARASLQGMKPCACQHERKPPRLIVLTGGPGAGKTAVLELVKHNFCEHVGVLPEAASIVFGGGFWRHPSSAGRKSAQRAIFHVQREQERLVLEEGQFMIGLCDRGTLDGMAYWPGNPEEFLKETGITLAEELKRYAAVIHLRTPGAGLGYNHDNPFRIESAVEAAVIDARLEAVWKDHPRRFLIDADQEFLRKAKQAIEILRAELPECCRNHAIAGFDN